MVRLIEVPAWIDRDAVTNPIATYTYGWVWLVATVGGEVCTAGDDTDAGEERP